MIGFGIMGLLVMIGCLVCTLLYIFLWDSSMAGKRNVAIIYLLTTPLNFLPERFNVLLVIGFLFQVALCIWYAIFLKMERL